MKTFLKKYWPIIVLGIILLTISILSFVPDKYLLSNDNYSPELNPKLTILRSLISPAWRSYRVLGFASDSEQADIFRAGLLGTIGLITGNNVAGQIYYFLSLIVGAFSMAFFIREMLSISKLRRYNNWGFLLGGIFYISTLWTVWTFYQSMAPFVTNFGFLPLLLLLIYRYIKDGSPQNALWLFIASILFTGTCVIATLFIVDIVLIGLFVCFWSIYSWGNWRIVLGKILKTMGIFIITQLFWILPFIHYTFTNSSSIIGSSVNRSITNSVIDLETDMQTAINTARFYSRVLTDSNGNGYLYPMSEDYGHYDFYKVISLIPAFFAVLGFFFALWKKNWKFVFFFAITFGAWFLIKVTNPPFGGIFTFLQEHIPLFKQVLRWPSSKLYEIFLICVDICAVLGFFYFVSFLKSFTKNKKAKLFISMTLGILVTASTLFYMEYPFLGNMFSKTALVNLPSEYYDLQKYMLENDTAGRIYYAPPSNENYFRIYDWGFRGSQFISYIVPNPVMDLSTAIGSSYGETAVQDMEKAFKAGDVLKFEMLLQQYDAKYILVDRSISEGGYTYNVDWTLSDTLWKGYEKVWSEGFLELYAVPAEEQTEYIEALDGNIGTFVRALSSNPQISPILMNGENWELESTNLIGNFTYMGTNTYLTMDQDIQELVKYPTKLMAQGSTIVATPSYPYIESKNYYKDPVRKYQNSDYDYYIIENNVFPKEAFEEGITVENSFGDKVNIAGINEESFIFTNLTENISVSGGEKCSDTAGNYEVKVVPQGSASGLEVTSSADISCAYVDLTLTPQAQYVAQVKLNWEQNSENALAGYCLYSELGDKCINQERYLPTDSPIGVYDSILPYTISGNDRISLILYVLNLEDSNASVTFREVSVGLSSTFEKPNLLEENSQIIDREISLVDGLQYNIVIPVVYGESNYVYDRSDSIWQPSVDAQEYGIEKENGISVNFRDGYLNLSNDLPSTLPQKDYLVYWSENNIANIPYSLCLIYSDSDICWFKETSFVGDSSSLYHFISSPNITNKVKAIDSNVSYSNETKNIFKNFVMMQTPESWNDVKYMPLTSNEYSVVNADVVGNGTYSTTYTIQSNQIPQENTLLAIPQAEDSGWLAVTNKLEILKDKVTVNGWKQGWDISDVEFNNIYVIYWPNLLGYLGYVLLASELVFILIKIFKKRKYGR